MLPTRTPPARSAGNDRRQAGAVVDHLGAIYAGRPDLARGRENLNGHLDGLFDGTEVIALAERSLMAPLDARSRSLVAASARRVALVTAVSPRALIDIAFVIYESVRLAGAIAALYGARPGFFGFWRAGKVREGSQLEAEAVEDAANLAHFSGVGGRN